MLTNAVKIHLSPDFNSITLEFDDTQSVSENSSYDEKFQKKEVGPKPNRKLCSLKIHLINIFRGLLLQSLRKC